MKSLNINSKKGFTIIEVVLVLAIAGLIFLMVFIALPNMQRSQRDTQRRNDYAALSSNMTAYMTNNNGSLPSDGAATVLASTAAEAAKKFINNTGQDPAGFTYSITVKTCSNDNCKGDSTNADEFKLAATSGSVATKVYIIKKATCANGYPKYLNSSRAFVIYGQLESGNGTYCSASQ